MSATVNVAIIGAGPYGLSLAAYLRASGIEFRIFGKPMSAWKFNMPPGMLLKSHPWSSSLYDPDSSYTLQRFSIERGIPYDDSKTPVPLELFVSYGEAFQARYAPHVEDKTLVSCEPTSSGIRASFDDGESLLARHLILAIGIHAFKYIPAPFEHLPAEVLSHSGDYGSLASLSSKKVVIIGAGSSAIDLAALLNEAGASVTLVARAQQLEFHKNPTTPRSHLKRLAYPLVRPILYPGSGIGTGWFLKTCADAPHLFRLLPEELRIRLVKTTLGPSSGPFMKERVVGRIPLRVGHHLESAVTTRRGVRLAVVGSAGKETLEADHVIAATGFKVDLHKLSFLSPNVLAKLRLVDGAPALSANYESSIPGLHFMGPASANSFGPVARFVFGAVHPARRLTRHLNRQVAVRSGASRKQTRRFAAARQQ